MEERMKYNPYYDAHETSLSKLNEHDWMILSSRWGRGIDWYVHKIGSQWAIIDAFGHWPLFKTKRAAGEAADNLLLAESRYRSGKRLGFIT